MGKIIFAESNGVLYIKAKYAGMHLLCLLTDGIPLTCFDGNDKNPYLTIDQAIDWHKHEVEVTNGQWKRDSLEALEKIKQKFKDGKMRIS